MHALLVGCRNLMACQQQSLQLTTYLKLSVSGAAEWQPCCSLLTANSTLAEIAS